MGVGSGTACERSHCGLRRSSLMGHDAMYWAGETGAGMGGGRSGGRKEENAGSCVFKTKTQHHRMVGTCIDPLPPRCRLVRWVGSARFRHVPAN
eukprot:8957766-Pyramimonas_sp.AAC.1